MSLLRCTISIPSHIKYALNHGEVILFDIKAGSYYGLDELGTEVFIKLANENTVGEIIQLLLREYEVSESRLGEDLENLVQDLLAEGLITINESRVAE